MAESTRITSSSKSPSSSAKKRCRMVARVLAALALPAIYGLYFLPTITIKSISSSSSLRIPKHDHFRPTTTIENVSSSSSSPLRLRFQKRDPPKVAWLLSFPNSGTTYTISNTEQVSQKQAATNYGKEMESDRIALYHESRNNSNANSGPPHINGSSTLPLPNKYILTKTHCGGYCSFCHPQDFVVLSADEMERKCLSEEGGKLQYNFRNVGRAIHLFRHPLDNIVSRMHHDAKHASSRVGTSSSQRDRLVYWCRGLSEVARKDLKTTKLMSMNMSRYIRRQPLCGVEFFRYIQWHNRVWEMTAARQLPVLNIFYEDYFIRYNDTVSSILEFLELSQSWEGTPVPLESNKTYRDLFTLKEIQATGKFMRVMALPAVWRLLKRYFPEFK